MSDRLHKNDQRPPPPRVSIRVAKKTTKKVTQPSPKQSTASKEGVHQ